VRGSHRPAVEQYRRDGFYFPIRVMSAPEALATRRRLEAVEAEHGGRLGGELRHKPHLLFTWLADLVRHPAILDPVEAVLGPNLLAWSSSFFIKEARDPAYVSWHQDATYWGLSAPDVLTAWVAFTTPRSRTGRCGWCRAHTTNSSPTATPSRRTICCRAAGDRGRGRRDARR
jgi:hypothetical protein